MSKTLIVYFSRTGITKNLAKDVAMRLNLDTFEVVPVKPYSNNYLMAVAQAKLDKRPAIVDNPKNLEQYDIVVIMFPIWWFSCPKVILTLLEKNNFTGKTIIPVCTYGSSGKGSSEQDMFTSCSTAQIEPCIEATDLKEQAPEKIIEAIRNVEAKLKKKK